jgi:hypothetical protein
MSGKLSGINGNQADASLVAVIELLYIRKTRSYTYILQAG